MLFALAVAVAAAQAEELHRQYLAAVFRRAQARRVLGRTKDALSDYRTLLGAFPDNPDVLREVGELEALLAHRPARKPAASSKASEPCAEGSMNGEGRQSAAEHRERDSSGSRHKQRTRLVVEEEEDSDGDGQGAKGDGSFQGEPTD